MSDLRERAKRAIEELFDFLEKDEKPDYEMVGIRLRSLKRTVDEAVRIAGGEN